MKPLWKSEIHFPEPGRVQHLRFFRDDDNGMSRIGAGDPAPRPSAGTPPHMSFFEVIELWRLDESFREFFTQTLVDCPFDAYRWETPGLNTATESREFECVLLNSPSLDRPVDRQAFSEHFRADADVTRFKNLRGDAELVVPCPLGKGDPAASNVYGHLGSFLRRAPQSQSTALWRHVGEAMAERLSSEPVWLSTAGMGVSWLHVRLDTRPKYYAYAPYKTPPRSL